MNHPIRSIVPTLKRSGKNGALGDVAAGASVEIGTGLLVLAAAAVVLWWILKKR